MICFVGICKKRERGMSMGVYDADTQRWVVFAFMYDWLGLGVRDVFRAITPGAINHFSSSH